MTTTSPTLVRFRELTQAGVNVEYQVHTVQTDGKATVEEILHVARERGLAAIAFTEHVRKETTWFDTWASDVRRAAQAYPELKVYVGCETKTLDVSGTLDVTDAILQNCDIVLGSVHRFPDGHGGYLDFKTLDADTLAEMECDLAVGLLLSAPIHVLAHPAGMYQRRYGAFPRHLWRRILEASLERSVAVEINSSYLVDVAAFLELCEEINPYVSIGSDVHALDEIGRCRDMLLERGVVTK
jgi:putative hydrolase